MKKIIFLLLLSISVKAQTYLPVGNALQRAPMANGYFFRTNLGTPGYVYWYTSHQIDSLVSGSVAGVSSFNARTGIVVSISADYAPFYPLLSGGYVNPSWITSLPYTKITGLATVASTGSYNDLSNKPTIYTFSGTSNQFTLGDGTYLTRNTSNVPEVTNLYYTDARVATYGDAHYYPLSTNPANYLTGNQTITLSGDISGSGTTGITTTIGASKVLNSMLANSSITINGTPISLGGSVTTTGGTVTSLTDNAANGVAITWTNRTTTPSPTVVLGAITPTSTNGVSAATMAFNDATSSIQTQINSKQASGNYITALTGEATASGPGSSAVTLTNSAVIGKVLTGYTSGAGTVSATDNILQAIQKLNGNIGAITTGVTSVSGTTNRITSTGGTTPVIDISSTFEGLLGKVANPLSQFASTTSAQLRGTLSDETGTGLAYFQGGDIGTPSAGVGTNFTGTATGLTAGNVTTNANLTGPVTSTGNATAIANGAISNAMLANGAVANLSGTNTGDQTITLTGDATGSGTASFATTLATVNTNTGSFGSSTSIPTFTVNGKGLITAASGNAVIAPAGTVTGTTLASNVVTSSLTSVGTLVGGSIPYSLLTGTPTVPTAANPTASVGLTAVNGSASTYMRSDGAPALDQTIAPTMTGSWIFQKNAIATTPTNAVFVANNTASTSGATVQYSPSLSFGGTAWNTSGTPANNFLNIKEEMRTASSGNPTATFFWSTSRSATSTPSYTDQMSMDNSGNLTLLNGTLLVNNADINISSSFGHYILHGTNVLFGDGTNNTNLRPVGAGLIVFQNNAGTNTDFSVDNSGAVIARSTVASGIAGTTIGGYKLSGNTSGTISILPQAAAGTYNYNMPTTAGTAGQLETSGGGGSSPNTWSSTSQVLSNLVIGTPTIAAGTGAGTSPTVSVTTNGLSLQVTCTTGTLPTGTNATVATVTLANALSYTPLPVFSSASGATSLLNGASMIYMTSTGTANVTITSGTTALTAATTYVWNISL